MKEQNLDIYEFQYLERQKLLKMSIRKLETCTATLEDCARVDRGYDTYVETLDWIPDGFSVEISSPGVYRNLSTLAHFREAVSETIKIKVKDVKLIESKGPSLILKKGPSYRGKLLSVEDDKICLDVEGLLLKTCLSNLKAANVDPTLASLLEKAKEY